MLWHFFFLRHSFPLFWDVIFCCSFWLFKWKCHATQTICHLTAYVQIPNLHAQQFHFFFHLIFFWFRRYRYDSKRDKTQTVFRLDFLLVFFFPFCAIRSVAWSTQNSCRDTWKTMKFYWRWKSCWCVRANPKMHRISSLSTPTRNIETVKKVCAFCQQIDKLR